MRLTRKWPVFGVSLGLAALTLLLVASPGLSQPPWPLGVEQLRQDSTGETEITWNPRTGTASFIRTQLPLASLGLATGATPADAALGLASRYAGLLGVEKPSEELALARTESDSLDMTHVTMRQVHQGVEVYGATVKVHLNGGQNLVAASSGFVPGIRLSNVTPAIRADEAVALARKALPSGALRGDPRLVVYVPPDKPSPAAFARLAWLVDLADDGIPVRNIYVIDARDGLIVEVLQRVANETVAAPTGGPLAVGTVDAVIHPCNWGDETPDSPIALKSPFAEGTDVVVGGLGYFYGDGDHSDYYNDYYATDWSAKADGSSTGGMDVYAIAEGDVVSASFTAIGNTVVINHAQNVQTTYAHLASMSVTAGAHVYPWTNIGVVGSTYGSGGYSSGPHLHLRFRQNGKSLYGQSPRPSPMDGQKLCDGQSIHAAPKTSGGSSPTITPTPTATSTPYQPGIPSLLSPPDSYSVQPNQLVNFSWSNTGASQYKFEAWNDTGQGNTSAYVSATTWAFAPAFAGSWRWQVRSMLGNGQPGDAPHTRSFTVAAAATSTATASATATPTPTATRIPTPTPTATRTLTPTPTATGGPSRSATPSPARNRQTFTASQGYRLPGSLARSEGQAATGDRDTDNAHDFAGLTYDYYLTTHGRSSFDGRGAGITSTVHYGRSFLNAGWNGEQMVYGDGFAVKDVVAHELTHAVTDYSAELEYRWQSGALNESISDIFGAMVDREDWLLGEDLPPSALAGRPGLRDMANPSRLGQPEHTSAWVKTCSDDQGVHINSGIMNKAYYNIATAIGKEKAERIFYRALTTYLEANSGLESARAAVLQAVQDFRQQEAGWTDADRTAVANGFKAVGLDGQWEPPANDCTCAATTALADQTTFPDRLSAINVAATLYRTRDQLLGQTATGRQYRTRYEQHTGRISYLLLIDPDLRANGGRILRQVTPGLDLLMDGRGDAAVVSRDMVDGARTFLQRLAESDRAHGGGALAAAIDQQLIRAGLTRLAGMTFADAWAYLNSGAGPQSITFMPFVSK